MGCMGSRTGLDDMNRLYTPEDYIRVMQKARKRTPKSSYYNEGRFFLNF
jgi:tRNA A37 methylthiotransferase MiaB